MTIELKLWGFVLLLLAASVAGFAVGYTVGSSKLFPVYILAGAAGITIASTAAYYFYYKPNRTLRQMPTDTRQSSRVDSFLSSALPLFSLTAAPSFASPLPECRA